MKEMAEHEIADLEAKLSANEEALIEALTPQDPNNERDVIIEIRAAAGGDESSIFAGELYRMYAKWAEDHSYKLELIK
jgi:peptide chain release factor 1